MSTQFILPSEASASLAFCLRLNRAYAVLTRRLDNALSGVHGLSFGDFMVLYYLGHAPQQRLRRTDLAERLGLTVSGATRTLLPLEKIGLIARQSDPRDARVAYATLTPAGQELLNNAMVSAEAACQEVAQVMSEQQMSSFSDVLGLLAGISLTKA